MTEATKYCFRCETPKPLSDFHRNARTPDGRQATCRSCRSKPGVADRRANATCSECGERIPQEIRRGARIPRTCPTAECRAARQRRLAAMFPCSVEDCESVAERSGANPMCSMHRHRLRRDGEVGPPGRSRRKRGSNTGCEAAGCGGRALAKGLCSMHWARQHATGETGPAAPLRLMCWVEGCGSGTWARGLCNLHYQRQLMTGDPGPLRRKKRGNGEGTVSNGYVRLTRPDGRKVDEHRFVMEQLLGRELKRHETVHHVNGQRADNRTNGPLVNFRSGNLELWSSMQPAGQRVADKVAFAVELLREYAPEMLAASVASRAAA